MRNEDLEIADLRSGLRRKEIRLENSYNRTWGQVEGGASWNACTLRTKPTER